MEKIKLEVKKLVKLLDDIKKSHSNFMDREISKMFNDLVGIENDDETERFDHLGEGFKTALSSRGNKNLRNFQKDLTSQYQSILDITINLNKLLDEPIKKVESLAEIKNKSLLTVSDVTKIYSFSKTQQQNFRGRLTNPLPHHKQSTKSKSSNSKIYYNKDEIDHWIKNFL